MSQHREFYKNYAGGTIFKIISGNNVFYEWRREYKAKSGNVVTSGCTARTIERLKKMIDGEEKENV